MGTYTINEGSPHARRFRHKKPSREKVSQCLILAAGYGSRLRPVSAGLPKPLVQFGGKPILEHVILRAHQAGIDDFVIVVGYGSDSIRRWFDSRWLGDLSITWVQNQDYHKHNGISVLKARDQIQENFLMLMADHIFEPGPLVKNKIAFTQSFEYRFVRTPVSSLPQLQRDIKYEGFNSFSQLDATLSERQSLSVSLALYPQKINYLGLNTFTPQPSTPDFHQREYMATKQHRDVMGPDALLVSGACQRL